MLKTTSKSAVLLLLLCTVVATFAQDTSNESICTRGYDPSLAKKIGHEYRVALKARDYNRLKELKKKREQLDLWQKSKGQCIDSDDSTHNSSGSNDAESTESSVTDNNGSGDNPVLVTKDNATIENCEAIFAEYQRSSQAILEQAGPDGRARNKAINQAYAKLALDHPNFKWAGLAAVASFNVGCAMDKIKGLQSGFFSGPITDSAADLDLVQDSLELGNQTLFLDIYTWHQLQINNPAAIAECQASENFPVNNYVKDGFAKTQGTEEEQWESLTELAIHEQINVLGQVIYRDQAFREQLDRNEFLGEFPLTSPAKAVLSSECNESDVDRVNVFSDSTPLFDRDHLWDDNQRMNWIAGVDSSGNSTGFNADIAAQWRGDYTPDVPNGHEIVFTHLGPSIQPKSKPGNPISEEERRSIIRAILDNP